MTFDRNNSTHRLIPSLALIPMLSMPVVFAAESAVSAASPRQVVEHTIAEIQAVLSQARGHLEKDPLEIFGAIDHCITHNADIPHVSRLMLGRHWREASDGQREQLVDLFHRFVLKLLTLTNPTTTSTVSTTDGSGGIDNITFLPAHITDNDGDQAVVPTLVSFEDAEDMRVTYRLRNDQGVWKVYDVVVDGISFVRLMRPSVASVIRRHDMDGLISLLEQKVTTTGYP